MKIITNKKKIRIGKILAAIYFIATQSIGEENQNILTENMEKIIDDVAELAFEIGGEKFASIEVPSAVYWLQNHIEKSED